MSLRKVRLAAMSRHDLSPRFDIRPTILFLIVFYLTVLARVIFSPLVLTLESELGISHADSGSLFLIMSLGYSPMLLLSGFVSARIYHRGAIVISILLVGGAMLFVSLGSNLRLLRVGVFLVGVASGLYTASGLTALVRIVPERHTGKAIGLHEVAPNLATITAPLIALILLRRLSWRGITIVISGACVLVGLLFLAFEKGSRFPGEPPRLRVVKVFFRDRSFWVTSSFFVLAGCAALGVYSMLPTYLVSERGMSEVFSGTLISLSRFVGLPLVFTAGWLVDRVGYRLLLPVTVIGTALMTVLLGVLPTNVLPPAIVLQPLFAVTYFPAGLAALSRIGPPEKRNVAYSLVFPMTMVIGGGIYPYVLGLLGESGRFYLGFIILGFVMVGAIPFLRLTRERGSR